MKSVMAVKKHMMKLITNVNATFFPVFTFGFDREYTATIIIAISRLIGMTTKKKNSIAAAIVIAGICFYP